MMVWHGCCVRVVGRLCVGCLMFSVAIASGCRSAPLGKGAQPSAESSASPADSKTESPHASETPSAKSLGQTEVSNAKATSEQSVARDKLAIQLVSANAP